MKATQKMNGETCLEKRGTVYCFRMKVPADLRVHLNKNEVRVGLKTKDRGATADLQRRRSFKNSVSSS